MSTDLLLTTADELFEMPPDGFRYELVRGVLQKMSPAGGEHGQIEAYLCGHLSLFVRKHRLGAVYSGDTGFQIHFDPDTVLSPDVGFVARERLQTIRDHRRFVPFAPDLAVEVLSPDDTYSKTINKIQDWLSAGTRAGVLVDPRKKNVSIYRANVPVVTLDESTELEVPDIIPGWTIPVSDIFQSA